MRNFTSFGDIVQVKPNIKQYIQFFTHDLIKPLPYQKFDLIICRNFLIYISKEHQRIVINNLIKVLRPQGYLMLGKTEGFPLLSTKLFSPEIIKEHIYRLNSTGHESPEELYFEEVIE
jgi:chemotaxis methyl-accepting protein methylase